MVRSAASNGKAVFGIATSTEGYAFGGQFESNSSDGIGVLGVANSVSGSNYGGNFQSRSSNGTGIYGVGLSLTGLNYGVYGQTDSLEGVGVSGIALALGGETIGLLGTTRSLKDGFGVFSQGRLGVAGTIATRLEVPGMPSKYLMFYAAQGPEPENIYNGTVTTDGNGEVWVQLPEHFSRINSDFRYQLTVVDGQDTNSFAQAKIARLIEGNRFKIRTSVPGVAVCWEVKGLRNDAFVRRYGAPTEIPRVGG